MISRSSLCKIAFNRGPEALQRLIDSAHLRKLAVILDVVFNLLGPDGNYLNQFSKAYFTDRPTDWSEESINFDGKSSHPVRDYFVHNARYWAREYHIDGLRLDAIQAISDGSDPHILSDIVTGIHDILPPDRSFLILAEDVKNQPLLVQPIGRSGFGIDAIMADDLHHQIYVALTGYQGGYYVDFTGKIKDIVETLSAGWFYTGQPSIWFGRVDGTPVERGEPTTAEDTPVAPAAIVHCIENHDQIGNRPDGPRLIQLINNRLDVYRAISALLLLSPYTPLLFMGQEWAAKTPFLFFTDHNEELGQKVADARQEDFARLYPDIPREQTLHPQDPNAFLNSKLNWNERNQPAHQKIWKLYQKLLEIRRSHPALQDRQRDKFDITQVSDHALAIQRYGATSTVLAIVNLHGASRSTYTSCLAQSSSGGMNWKYCLIPKMRHGVAIRASR